MSSKSTSTNSRGSSGANNSDPHRNLRAPGDVPNAVRQLLLSTKDLQTILGQWSLGSATETEISNIFVKVGTDFHTTIDAFAYYGIDLNHIGTFIEDLRTVLEQCLSNDPTPEMLNEYMPGVRKVLYRLLKGLQARQQAWQSASGRAAFMSTDEAGWTL
ncbi:hypothetical protein P691DRAFT_797255 [Macrolepiota fuliginosa MF-IS2]|uniref:Aip3p/Bud6 N-terminal domain-containing protein n=1 Tax=Macrolepiota fuliginosa MF-IS2 TaxID=1400762 RepID=A0A9P5XHR9_9AGAR|nr:hypothetical protein P691DRAFT_797255 [Macrolepiota fuliginosa MF-IS2]